MNKSVKKIIVTSASLLMMASIGTEVSSLSRPVHGAKVNVQNQLSKKTTRRHKAHKYTKKSKRTSKKRRTRAKHHKARKHHAESNAEIIESLRKQGASSGYVGGATSEQKRDEARATAWANKVDRNNDIKDYESEGMTHSQAVAHENAYEKQKQAKAKGTFTKSDHHTAKKHRRHAKRNMKKRRTKKVAKRNHRRSNKRTRRRNKRRHIDPTEILGHADESTPVSRKLAPEGEKLDQEFLQHDAIETGKEQGLTPQQSLERQVLLRKLRSNVPNVSRKVYDGLSTANGSNFNKAIKPVEKLVGKPHVTKAYTKKVLANLNYVAHHQPND